MEPVTSAIVESHYKCPGCRLWARADLQICEFCDVPAVPSSPLVGSGMVYSC